MDVLIFDMDGVLIDVSKSYRRTIQRTVQIYLQTCLGFKKSKRGIITDAEISLFKSAGGFNNDWDLTSGILLYLLSISGIPPLAKRKRFSTVQETVQYLKKRSSTASRSIAALSKRKNLPLFLEKVKSAGGGLRGIRLTLKSYWEGWVYRSGDLDRENVVERIFQEAYLGRMFTSRYRLPRLFYRGQGYYLREKLMIPRRILSILLEKLRLGIASGRPRFEAELALKRFRLLPYFDSVVTLEDCARSKPYPDPILKAAGGIGLSDPQCAYIGDVVDDMKAAGAAKKKLRILAVGFVEKRKKRQEMIRALIAAGADLVIEKPDDLLQLVSDCRMQSLRPVISYRIKDC